MGIMAYIGKQFHEPTGLGGRLATFVMNKQNRQQYDGTEAALALSGSGTVLDIGFGNGYMLHRLAEKYSGHFYGIDISPDMLRVASIRNKKHINAGDMSLSVASAERTALADGLIDKAYTINTVYFWSSLDAGLAEIWRILKPGGIFVNTFYTKEMLDHVPVARSGYAKYEIDEFLASGRRNGFQAEARPIVIGRSYCVVYKKLERL